MECTTSGRSLPKRFRKRLDEAGQRQLPGLLIGVIELAEFPGVHAELASHLHMGVREMVSLACRDPFLQASICARGLRAHVPATAS